MTSPAQRDQTESSRLDNFVDGAFAFAVTMLVVNGADIPRDTASLVDALKEVPAFAACFVQLALFWHGHVRWREMVRSIDAPSLLLSLLLVFFALIFVYPLHLVFASFFYAMSDGVLNADILINSTWELKFIFICYGLAYTCMAGTLAALYALGQREAPNRSAAERIESGANMACWAYGAAIGLLSAATASLIPKQYPALIWIPGLMYALMFFTGQIDSMYRRRKLQT